MGTEIINYDEAYAKAAEGYAAQNRAVGGETISTQSGVLNLGDNELVGNQLACVILDSTLENAFYPGRYDANVKLPPVCYSSSREAEGMEAHLQSMGADKTYFTPQNMQQVPIDENAPTLGMRWASPCDGCKQNIWGSGDQGRGKACKNNYRLALLPAGIYEPRGRDYDLALYDDPQHYAGASVAYMKIPVTSGKFFEAYRTQMRTQHRRPPFGVFTRIYLTPHKDHQFHVNFEFIELADPALGQTLFARNRELTSEAFKGYEPPSPEDKAKAGGGAGARGSFGRR